MKAIKKLSVFLMFVFVFAFTVSAYAADSNDIKKAQKQEKQDKEDNKATLEGTYDLSAAISDGENIVDELGDILEEAGAYKKIPFASLDLTSDGKYKMYCQVKKANVDEETGTYEVKDKKIIFTSSENEVMEGKINDDEISIDMTDIEYVFVKRQADVSGYYDVISMTDGKIEIMDGAKEVLKEYGYDEDTPYMTIELKKDESIIIKSEVEELELGEAEGKYKIKDSAFTITSEDEVIDGAIIGKYIYFNSEGYDCIFEKREESIVGAYDIISMKEDGEEMMDMLKEAFEILGIDKDTPFVTLELTKDGKFIFSSEVEEADIEAFEGTYSVKDKKLILTIDDGDLECKMEGTKITMEDDGTVMVFEKRKK